MNFTRIISIISAASLSAVLLAGCGGTNGTSSGDDAPAENSEAEYTSDTENLTMEAEHDMNTEMIYTADPNNVKSLGRTYFSEDKLYCALSGTGAEFSFTGTKCSVSVYGDPNATALLTSNNKARIGIYVNGERVIDDMVDQSCEVYEVFESEAPQETVVSVVKLSESPMSTFAIGEIKVTGTEIQPTPEKELFIEFIGDSITCG